MSMPSPSALYPVADIRRIEHAALTSLPPGSLMERAGTAAARQAMELLPHPHGKFNVLVVAGPGNNGGDALVAARVLKESGIDSTVLLCDAPRRPADAQQALDKARAAGLTILPAKADAIAVATQYDLVIDGLFGIGLARPIAGPMRVLVEAVNALACPVLALDVPSGLDADTGTIVGDGIAVRASHTLTFIADKPGLHTCDGRDHAGEVQVEDLGIDHALFPPATAHLNGIDAFAGYLRKRTQNSHKGSYGDVMVVGGAHGMSGAPILSARAAAHCGAGRVFACFLENPPAYDSAHPELMCRRAADMDFSSATLVIGPGLGTSQAARDMLAEGLGKGQAIVLDADALNLIASDSALQALLAQRDTPALMTPHPLEAARLLQVSTKEIQSDRLASARRIALRFNAAVILKGSGSIIAQPDGQIMINTTGNPALATAGTGDVLAGICGALLAQHFPAWQAALAATWLHGAAADKLVAEGTGPIGLTASELIPRVRTLLNRLTEQHGR